MKKVIRQLGWLLIALGIIAGVLGFSVYASHQLRESAVVTQSKVLRSILSEDSVGVISFVQSTENRDMLRGFVTAVTDAYVNFELIPVNEGKTFTAIFTNLNDEVFIDHFAYHRRDLELSGVATKEGYATFLKGLAEENHFDSIEEIERLPWENERIHFTILCKAQPVVTPGVFAE